MQRRVVGGYGVTSTPRRQERREKPIASVSCENEQGTPSQLARNSDAYQELQGGPVYCRSPSTRVGPTWSTKVESDEVN